MRAGYALRVLAAVIVLGGCSVSTGDTETSIDDDSVPYGLLDPDAIAVVPQETGSQTDLCLLRGDALVQVTRRLASPVSLLDVARALAEVTASDTAAELRTSLVAGDEIVSVELAAGVATVDLAEEASQRLTADPLATVAQLVCTLTSQAGVGLVRFTVSQVPVEVPLADGTLSNGPVSADAYGVLRAAPEGPSS
jgi:hypothetical protein